MEALYSETCERLVDLVQDAGTQQAYDTVVPACPEWTVHGVLSHLTGLGADVFSGNVSCAGSPEWTADQVAARADRSTEEVLDEWQQVGPQLAALLDDFPGRYGQQVVADLAVHEQDVRGALDKPGARDSDAVQHAVEFLMSTLVDPGATALGVGPLEIRADDRCWIVGTGEAPAGDPNSVIAAALSGDRSASPTRAAPLAALNVDSFSLFRAATGRRSPAQIRAFGWTSEPDPFLCLFDLWPFRLRPDDLVE